MWDAPRNAWGQWDYIDLAAGKDALPDSIQVCAPPLDMRSGTGTKAQEGLVPGLFQVYPTPPICNYQTVRL